MTRAFTGCDGGTLPRVRPSPSKLLLDCLPQQFPMVSCRLAVYVYEQYQRVWTDNTNWHAGDRVGMSADVVEQPSHQLGRLVCGGNG